MPAARGIVANGLALLAAAAVTAGCAGAGAATPPAGRSLRVTERDFHIAAPARVAAGRVTFTVHNDGPDTHELLIARLDGRRLPRRADDLTVDEHALGPAAAGEAEAVPAGGRRRVAVDLRPGRYVLFCNMTGHYLGGMRRELVVG